MAEITISFNTNRMTACQISAVASDIINAIENYCNEDEYILHCNLPNCEKVTEEPKRVVDRLKDNTMYLTQIDFLGWYEKGTVISGKMIKDGIPFDISPNTPIDEFFKEL